MVIYSMNRYLLSDTFRGLILVPQNEQSWSLEVRVGKHVLSKVNVNPQTDSIAEIILKNFSAYTELYVESDILDAFKNNLEQKGNK